MNALSRNTWISEWEPENPEFWATRGRAIARRNLVFSIVAENIGFSVWMLWSVVATRLPRAGFPYTTEQLFGLVALPGLIGALMRFPYTFAVPRFGGRNWTMVSALLLLIPSGSLAFLVTRPSTPLWLMMLAASTAGLGGGNFASSMANISFFFPDKEKGLALGLNAAGGNIGVSVVQLVVPMVIAALGLAFAGILWMPFIVIAAASAFFFMDNLSSARSTFRDQIAVTRSPHTWTMAWLYVGTFGSFIGYSAAFPLLIKTSFPTVTVELAFLGPLVGSVARPLGGWLADKLGGTRVTFWNFAAMTAASALVTVALRAHSFGMFLSMFLLLFVTTGLGNGSTYRMIPVIFRASNARAASGKGQAAIDEAMRVARRESAAVIGITSAVGALGGFFIPKSFGASIKATGGPTIALSCFVAFYLTCMLVTWWCYMRTRFLVASVPSLAEANA